MGVFVTEGKATKEVICDVAMIRITFKKIGQITHELAKSVVDECDRFIREVSKLGVQANDIRFDDDDIGNRRYRDDDKIVAARYISLMAPFDMKFINMIQDILISGEFCYELEINGICSNRSEIRMEMAKEALLNAKNAAEQLAGVLGLTVKGVESVQSDELEGKYYDEDDYILYRRKEYHKDISDDRPSNDIGAKVEEETVRLKVKWILE